MEGPGHCVRFLFSDHGLLTIPQRVEEHRHPFWQLEYASAGSCRGTLDGEGFVLAAGEVLLVAPGQVHGFDYTQPSFRRLSLKFALAGTPPLLGIGLHRGAALDAVMTALHRLLPEDAVPGPATCAAIGHLIAAALCLAGQGTAGSPEPASVRERVLAILEAGDGQRWTVAGLARRLGYSPGHLSARFRGECGEPLKKAMDRSRALVAEQLLADPRLPLARIAELLEFPDPSTFSRFFRRVRGQVPGRCRLRT